MLELHIAAMTLSAIASLDVLGPLVAVVALLDAGLLTAIWIEWEAQREDNLIRELQRSAYVARVSRSGTSQPVRHRTPLAPYRS